MRDTTKAACPRCSKIVEWVQGCFNGGPSPHDLPSGVPCRPPPVPPVVSFTIPKGLQFPVIDTKTITDNSMMSLPVVVLESQPVGLLTMLAGGFFSARMRRIHDMDDMKGMNIVAIVDPGGRAAGDELLDAVWDRICSRVGVIPPT